MRSLEVWHAGAETAAAGFDRDQAMMAVAGWERRALTRLWHRDEAGVCLGRYHRLAETGRGLERRITGGRAVPSGPGILGITAALPETDWLGPSLRPEQILNRALRPLLSLLRGLGVDVFYPGRDLITIARRPVGHASFTRMSDGVVLVEMHLALESSFARLPELLAAADPDGVAAVDGASLADSTSLAESLRPPDGPAWTRAWAEHAEKTLGWDASASERCPDPIAGAAGSEGAAFEAMQRERGPVPEGAATAAALSMLGAVEVTASIEGGRIGGLVVTGDVIAPFETLDAIGRACEGLRPKEAEVRRAITSALGRPDRFLLGITDLEEPISRLAR